MSSGRNASGEMTRAERDEAIREANKTMKGYVETRILAKQGKLKKRAPSAQTQSASKIQLSLLLSLLAAFVASPILGKKIAQDEEFRNKYVPGKSYAVYYIWPMIQQQDTDS
jgi:oligoribonuclease (3'-5' exoribonuclease)